MRKALAILALVAASLWAAPVLAESSPTVDLAGWVKANTDLVVSQVAIAGPENVYSLEPMGPRLPTGEVLALVRTEAVSDGWRAAHRFQSWDAHMLFDCQGGRARVLRSTSYLERDRQGAAKPDDRGDAWFAPQPETPAATLLAAACDPGFSWPLRASPAVTPPSPSPAPAPIPTTIAAATPPAQPVQSKPAAVEQAVALAAVERTPATPKVEKAVSPDMAQFTSLASAHPAIAPIRKASFTAAPATLQPAAPSPEHAVVAPRQSRILATAATATRTCRQLASSGGGWLWRRVELAFHRDGSPTRRQAGVIRQAQLS